MENSKTATLEETRNRPPVVSVVIPCLNEGKVIAKCLDSLVESDYPKHALEVWVVDGLSQDDSREIVAEYARRYTFIHLIDNPKRTQQAALNLGIQHARGEVIIRMDAHCGFSTNYISQCVRYLMESGADNVGGRLITVPREDSLVGRAIALAMSERFGVGNSHFRVRPPSHDLEPKWVRSVPYSCYQRSVFERIGLFNELLDRSEDAEFHRRMRDAGFRTLFVPTIVSHYYARSDLRSFWSHAVDNGRWAVLPTVYTGRLVVSFRHLMPMAFIGCLIVVGALAPVRPMFGVVFAGLLGSYLAANLGASCFVAIREEDARYLAVMPLVFSMLHVGYGTGSFLGIARALWLKITGDSTLGRVGVREGGSSGTSGLRTP